MPRETPGRLGVAGGDTRPSRQRQRGGHRHFRCSAGRSGAAAPLCPGKHRDCKSAASSASHLRPQHHSRQIGFGAHPTHGKIPARPLRGAGRGQVPRCRPRLVPSPPVPPNCPLRDRSAPGSARGPPLQTAAPPGAPRGGGRTAPGSRCLPAGSGAAERRVCYRLRARGQRRASSGAVGRDGPRLPHCAQRRPPSPPQPPRPARPPDPEPGAFCRPDGSVHPSATAPLPGADRRQARPGLGGAAGALPPQRAGLVRPRGRGLAALRSTPGPRRDPAWAFPSGRMLVSPPRPG